MDEWLVVAVELRQKKAIEVLSARELQVFILSGRGKSMAVIGTILGVSKRTAATHRLHISRKMGFESVYEMMAYCIKADMDTNAFMDKYIS